MRELKKDVLNRHVMILDLYPDESRPIRVSNVYEENTDSEFYTSSNKRIVREGTIVRPNGANTPMYWLKLI